LSREPLEIADVFFCSSITVLMLLGARRLWRQDRESARAFLALITIFPFTYYFTHATPDYRQPIEPEVVVLVVMGILSLKSRKEPLVILDVTMEEEESRMSMTMSGLGAALNEEASF
jgi:hypothetical protein